MTEKALTQVRQSHSLLGVPDISALVGEPLVCTDEAGQIVLFNAAAEEAFGYSAEEVLGEPVEMLIPQRYRSEHQRHVRNFAVGDGTARRIMGQKRQVCAMRKNGEEFPAEAIVTRQVVEGQTYLTVAHRDITERKRLERERELISKELAHRVKNILTVVDSLLSLSAREAENVEELAQSLRERLSALAVTQDLIREGNGRSAGMKELLSKELGQYRVGDSANLQIDGPAIELKASAAVILALAFHELATNAAKYGALSRPVGVLHVVWRVCEGRTKKLLEITWRETGGPQVRRPDRTGFGTRLITEAVNRGLKATVDLDYPPDGLICRMQIPLEQLSSGAPK